MPGGFAWEREMKDEKRGVWQRGKLNKVRKGKGERQQKEKRGAGSSTPGGSI